ncbi:glutamine amidotransferase [Sphingomonas jatrophae]|uniref:GMP synthase (Glutamine-hydrolysing) n=1 Tax=Sphingomonas jatrophae TaxID=1166337 RepID=A0A1I6JCS3_9SPHN|nr:glutamine amidotransferase [Sphingomonas jatrophae]SFR76747.1 GMP synthase (glutamine-hydrolysing) [Sphingomonas jatrophae]
MKRGLIVRHTPYEGIAGFRQPIEAAGYVLDRVDVSDCAFRETDFLAPDLLLMMGGPMGVYERHAYPWIDCEVDRLAERLARGLPTLGVCLGAQMIAASLGSNVFAGPTKEVGFAPVMLTAAGQASPLRHIAGVPVLHWHGDTFDLPEGVELLASTERYAHQAFRKGPTLLALQCHAEMGLDPRFEAWLAGADEYVAEGGTDPASLRAAHAALGAQAVAAGRRMIVEWLAGL